MSLIVIIIVILAILFLVSLFYRPLGSGYYSYGPSGLFVVILVILLLLYLTGHL